MKVTINEKEYFFDKNISVTQLVQDFSLNISQIAIERNLSIIPASDYDQVNLEDGDNIEIVHFIGGG